MALPRKQVKKEAKIEVNWQDMVYHLAERVTTLENQVYQLLYPEPIVPSSKATASIHHLEDFNGETEPPQTDNLKMNQDDKIQSMRNAIKILPPNLKVNGKHTAMNIGAICGFIVDEDLYNRVYDGWSDED